MRIETRDFGPGRTLLAESDWDWMLFRDAADDLVLSVVCGTIGVFEVEVILDPSQRAAYDAEGTPFLDRLAADIRYSPRKYMAPR